MRRQITLRGTPDPGIVSQISTAAASNGIPPSIALSVANAESGFNQSAVSSAGAIGIMQLEPSSFPGYDVTDESTNISLGVGYLAQLYNQFGNWVDALAAYNWGPGNMSSGKPIPSSVQGYASGVLSNASQIDAAQPSVSALDLPDMGDNSGDDVSGGLDPSSIVPLVLLGAVGVVVLIATWN